ncbi:unnamed protein product [Orchesella dallaii]|uniref:Uncharacterized protein n=1 Tax=Orchesella dallaii TaxID=48710 RepID=A0ABP1PHU5_9HEXA
METRDNSRTIEFCSRKADSGYTVDEMRRPKTAIETYRKLQILTQCFNDCMAPMVMPTIKFAVVGALIPCGYVFIRSMNQKFIDEFPGICEHYLEYQLLS